MGLFWVSLCIIMKWPPRLADKKKKKNSGIFFGCHVILASSSVNSVQSVVASMLIGLLDKE